MSEFSVRPSISGDRIERPGLDARVPQRRSTLAPSTPGRGLDRLDVSDRARSAVADAAAQRAARLDAIRAEIKAGTYDTPQRLDAALDRMIDAALARPAR